MACVTIRILLVNVDDKLCLDGYLGRCDHDHYYCKGSNASGKCFLAYKK